MTGFEPRIFGVRSNQLSHDHYPCFKELLFPKCPQNIVPHNIIFYTDEFFNVAEK